VMIRISEGSVISDGANKMKADDQKITDLTKVLELPPNTQ